MLWILIGYMFLFIHRPFEIWPSLATVRLERIYMLFALGAVLAAPNKKWLSNVQHLAYFAFAVAVLMCWLASPWAEHGELVVENYFKILVFYVLIVLVVHDEQTFRRLLLAFLVIMALYMTHSLWEYRNGRHTYRMGIARMIGVDKTLGDPNSFGASLLYALPFVVPFWKSRPSQLLRVFLVGYVGLSGLCIGLTGSRSSFLGLSLWLLFLIVRSRWRGRLFALAVCAAPVCWALLPPSLQTRFETIINPEVGPANAKTSGESRLEGLVIGLKLWSDNPLTGCGPGAWKPATGRLIESHNLYGQVMGEMGMMGALTFAAILLGFWLNLRWLRRTYRLHPDWGQDFLYQAAGAVGMGVFLMLFEGNFGHNLFRFSWLWYGGFLIIACHCVKLRLNEQTQLLGWQPWSSPVPAWGSG
jgi:hypothetical protein